MQLCAELWDIASVQIPALSKNTHRPHPASALRMLRSSVPLSRLLEPSLLIPIPSLRVRATGYHCCNVQDGILTFNVYRHHEKPWVEQLMVPYLVFFAVACVVSLFTLGQKGKLLVDKFRQRQAASNNAVESVETLEEKLIANKMEIRKICCTLLLGATEGARCDFEYLTRKLIGFTQPPLCSRVCQRLGCAACACATFAMQFARR